MCNSWNLIYVCSIQIEVAKCFGIKFMLRHQCCLVSGYYLLWVVSQQYFCIFTVLVVIIPPRSSDGYRTHACACMPILSHLGKQNCVAHSPQLYGRGIRCCSSKLRVEMASYRQSWQVHFFCSPHFTCNPDHQVVVQSFADIFNFQLLTGGSLAQLVYAYCGGEHCPSVC